MDEVRRLPDAVQQPQPVGKGRSPQPQSPRPDRLPDAPERHPDSRGGGRRPAPDDQQRPAAGPEETDEDAPLGSHLDQKA